MNVKFEEVHAALDVWIVGIMTYLRLHEDGKHGDAMPKSGYQSILTGWHCPHQTGLSNFVHEERENTGLLVIVIRKERRLY